MCEISFTNRYDAGGDKGDKMELTSSEEEVLTMLYGDDDLQRGLAMIFMRGMPNPDTGLYDSKSTLERLTKFVLADREYQRDQILKELLDQGPKDQTMTNIKWRALVDSKRTTGHGA